MSFATDSYVTKLMIREVSKTKTITREEEQVLFGMYKTADVYMKEVIKEKLVSSNLRFVLKVSLFYHRNRLGVDLNDLMSEGKLGLIKSVDLFDPDKGIKFISFAVWHIKCKINKFLEERDVVRIPSHQRSKLMSMRKSGELYENDDMLLLNEMTREAVSFDANVGDTDYTIGDTIKDESIPDPDEAMTRDNIHNELLDAINNLLEPEEQTIIKNIFGLNGNDPIGLQEASSLVGKNSERIRQLKNRALKKLSRSTKIKSMHLILNSIHD